MVIYERSSLLQEAGDRPRRRGRLPRFRRPGPSPPLPTREWLPFQEAFFQSCLDAGFSECSDINHPEAAGVGPIPMNNPNDIRMSTALAYVNPNRHRLNLTIRGGAQATRILFNGNKATGVEVESGRERFEVEGEEIILSAGAITSPQLLMLSGIGPAYHLNSLGIPVTQHLPGVGQNLKDHPALALQVRLREGFTLTPALPRLQTLLHYTAEGSYTEMTCRYCHLATCRRVAEQVVRPTDLNSCAT